MHAGRRGRYALFGALAVALLTFQVAAIHHQSLTLDEPYHLIAGHQALRYGLNTLNLEHPPLVKLVAALPSLAEAEPLAPLLTVPAALPASRELFEDAARAHRLRVRGRTLVMVLFALPLLAACVYLGRQVSGGLTGAVLAGAIGLSVSTAPFLSAIQTDCATTLGVTLLLGAGLAYLRRPALSTALWIGLGLGIAWGSKLSGLLFTPSAVLPFLLAPQAAERHRWHALGRPAAALLVALLPLLGSYALANRDYQSVAGRAAIRAYTHGQATLVAADRLTPAEPFLLRVESTSPSLAQYLTGAFALRAHDQNSVILSYALGRVTSRRRWWFFPFTWLVKTPLVLLLATVASLWTHLSRRPQRDRSDPSDSPRRRLGARELLVLLTGPALFLLAALTSTLNLGVRYLLPAMPVLFLPASIWAGARLRRAAIVLGILALEACLLFPVWMSATNTWWLGSANPTRFALAWSSGEFKQNLLTLASEARRRQLGSLGVLFPIATDAEIRAYLPQGRLVEPDAQGGDPLPPGWYAVTVMLEQLVPAIRRADPDDIWSYEIYRQRADSWEALLQQLRDGEDHGYLAGTFHLYRLAEPAQAAP